MLRVTHMNGLGSLDLSTISPEQMATWGECDLTDPFSQKCATTGAEAAAIFAASEATGLDQQTIRDAKDCVSGGAEACAKSAAVAGATYACVAGVSAMGAPIAAPLCGTVAGEVVNLVWEPLTGLVSGIGDLVGAGKKANYRKFGNDIAARVEALYWSAVLKVTAAATEQRNHGAQIPEDFNAESFLLERMPPDWFKAWTYAMSANEWNNVWSQMPIYEGIVKKGRWLAIAEGVPFYFPTQADIERDPKLMWHSKGYNYGWGRWPGNEKDATYHTFAGALANMYAVKRIEPLRQALATALTDLTAMSVVHRMVKKSITTVPITNRLDLINKILSTPSHAAPAVRLSPARTAVISKMVQRLTSPRLTKPPPRRVLPRNEPEPKYPTWALVLGGASILAIVGSGVWYLTQGES